jgi:uncharacterized repeat protein (TIGR01451 family)
VALASLSPRTADLQLGKTVSNPRPNVGDAITFTIRLTNNGPSGATSVQVTDLLPAGLTFVAAAPDQGSYNSNTGVWDVGSVPAGTMPTLAIQAVVVSPAPQTNTAAISQADQFDPNPANNTGSATETPQQTDLSLNKSVSNATPNVGDTIAFTLTLANNGPDAATNVVVTDLLPAGLTFRVGDAQPGHVRPGHGRLVRGTVTAGAFATTLVLQVQVVSPSPRTNTAAITDADQFDPNPGNNTASATETPQ